MLHEGYRGKGKFSAGGDGFATKQPGKDKVSHTVGYGGSRRFLVAWRDGQGLRIVRIGARLGVAERRRTHMRGRGGGIRRMMRGRGVAWLGPLALLRRRRSRAMENGVVALLVALGEQHSTQKEGDSESEWASVRQPEHIWITWGALFILRDRATPTKGK